MRTYETGGYRVVTGLQGHPLAYRNSWLHEHVYIMYAAVGPGPHFCAVCDIELQWRNGAHGIHVDHIDDNGLNNALANLQILCNVCNIRKGADTEKLRARGYEVNARSYTCKKCDVPCTSLGQLRGHSRWHHPKVKPS